MHEAAIQHLHVSICTTDQVDRTARHPHLCLIIGWLLLTASCIWQVRLLPMVVVLLLVLLMVVAVVVLLLLLVLGSGGPWWRCGRCLGQPA